jgi:hypothetical protein
MIAWPVLNKKNFLLQKIEKIYNLSVIQPGQSSLSVGFQR